MSNDKVMCQCCGKMMVPRVIFGGGTWLGWGMRTRSRAVGNVCPFCLSENWDGGNRPQYRSPGQTILRVLAVMFVLMIVVGIFKESLLAFGYAMTPYLSSAMEWSLLFIAVLLYRRYRFK